MSRAVRIAIIFYFGSSRLWLHNWFCVPFIAFLWCYLIALLTENEQRLYRKNTMIRGNAWLSYWSYAGFWGAMRLGGAV